VCDDVFTCGHPPGLLPPELTDPPTSGDAGVDAGADAAEPTIK